MLQIHIKSSQTFIEEINNLGQLKYTTMHLFPRYCMMLKMMPKIALDYFHWLIIRRLNGSLPAMVWFTTMHLGSCKNSERKQNNNVNVQAMLVTNNLIISCNKCPFFHRIDIWIAKLAGDSKMHCFINPLAHLSERTRLLINYPINYCNALTQQKFLQLILQARTTLLNWNAMKWTALKVPLAKWLDGIVS